jgi:AAA15 family ATPase/GTPase
MLLAFEVENYRSLRDRCVLNLTRSPRAFVKEFPHPDVVPAIAIFGSNASGKTNLLRAMGTMFAMIRRSAMEVDERLPYTPYALAGDSSTPTHFQVVVRFDGVRYDYGFSYDSERIISEWLYSWPKSRQRVLYERNDDVGFYFGDSLGGANQALAKATRRDALFLSTAKVLNHDILSSVQEGLANLARSVSSESLPELLQRTLERLSQDPLRESQVTKLMTRAEFGVVGLSIEESPIPDEMRAALQQFVAALNPEMSQDELSRLERAQLLPQLEHMGSKGKVAIPFAWESVGTRNFLALLGPILDRLSTGGVLVVDEIDTSLHPRLVSELVRLFQDPELNPRQAQLLLSTHDVTVMMNTGDYNVLARDQVWFVEKSPEGVTKLYPLLDFKPRDHEVFSRNYLMGRYGAVPAIDDSAFGDLWDEAPQRI